MLDHNDYAGLGIVGEVLLQIKNVVKLHNTEHHQYGLPVAHVTFSHHENDKRMVAHAKLKMKEILDAAGGEAIWTADRTAHLLGTCRMGNDPENSVVNADCRSHDVRISTSVTARCTTSTGANLHSPSKLSPPPLPIRSAIRKARAQYFACRFGIIGDESNGKYYEVR